MRLLAIGSLLALAACNPGPAAYAPGVEHNFMTACEAQQGSSVALCGCTWEKIEAEISPNDFAALERLPQQQRETHPLTTQINGYVEACAISLTPPVEPAADDPVPEP
ncbi:MAG: hypothetical protein R3C30_11255 [Hyphomonadaceae bacterium]